MSGPEQLDFFEKGKISDRQEPIAEEEEAVPNEEDAPSRASKQKRGKKTEKQAVSRMLDRLYRKLGARPQNPQEELLEDE